MISTVIAEFKETTLLGNLNINYMKKNDNKAVKNVFHEYGFKQIINQPTRITNTSSTLIDCVLTTNENIISTHDVIPTSISDHDMVGYVRKMNHCKVAPKVIRCRNFSRYNHESLKADLKDVDWEPLYSISDVNNAWLFIKDSLLNAFDKHAPIIRKRVKGRFCPWLTAEIRQKMNNRDKLLRKARKTQNETDWNNYRKLRNNCTNDIRLAKSNFNQNLLAENSKHPRKFWQTIKQIFPVKSKSNAAPSRYLENETTNTRSTDPKEKVNMFCNFFTNVASFLKRSSIHLKDFVWHYHKNNTLKTCKSFRFGYVSVVFVRKELKKLKRHKATGCDDLPPGLLKDCADEISHPLHYLINLSLKTAEIPTEWKHALVTPIYKSGSSSKVDNYRPISIIPILAKILEKSVHSQLIDFLEENHLLSSQQFGYRRNRSTSIAATLFIDNIRKELDRGNLVGAVFIDLSKAFDTVGHSIILSKLTSYGINGNELNWFTNYLFNRTQQVVKDSVKSDSMHVTCGVPQGSILGPLLFLIYFNDFENVLRKANTVMFADDTVIYFADKCANKIENVLNNEMKHINSYFIENDLVINLKKGKTESMLFGTAPKLKAIPDDMHLKYEFTEINKTTNYKYLGSVIDPKLSLNENFDRSCKKASSRLRLLKALRTNIDNNTAATIYNVMITPLIMFNSTIKLNFSNTQLNRLSSLDNRATQISKIAIPSTRDLIVRNACKMVYKCIQKESCYNLHNYFQILSHEKFTRNNAYIVQLPKVKLETAKSGFYFMGAKLYNSLPLDIRKSNSFYEFNTKIKGHTF